MLETTSDLFSQKRRAPTLKRCRWNFVTNTKKCLQHKITNINLGPTFMWPHFWDWKCSPHRDWWLFSSSTITKRHQHPSTTSNKIINTCKTSSCSRLIWISKCSAGNPLIQSVTRSVYLLASYIWFLYLRLVNFSFSSLVFPDRTRTRSSVDSDNPKLPNLEVILSSSSGKNWINSNTNLLSSANYLYNLDRDCQHIVWLNGQATGRIHDWNRWIIE